MRLIPITRGQRIRAAQRMTWLPMKLLKPLIYCLPGQYRVDTGLNPRQMMYAPVQLMQG